MIDRVSGGCTVDGDTRIRIAATIGVVEPCTPLERMARAIAACDNIEIDGSERGEILFGRRRHLYRRHARAAIESLRASKAELANAALDEHRRLSEAGASEVEIIASCFETMLEAILEDGR